MLSTAIPIVIAAIVIVIISKGIDDIYCLSVNDKYVMKSWLISYSEENKIIGIADGNAEIVNHFKLISDKTKIEINVSGREDFHLLSIDTKIISLKQGMSIIIEKSPIKFKLVNMDGNSYYETLREKLFWGKDKRN